MTGNHDHMHHRKRNSHSIRTAVTALFAVGLLLLLLPSRWTRGLIGLVQITVPFQDAVGTSMDYLTPSLTENEPSQETIRIQTLEHTVAALAGQIRALEEETLRLRGTREWSANGRRFGQHGQLVPAQIISKDLMPWRSSRLLNVGTVQGVDRHSPVMSKSFSLNTGEADGVYPGMAILLRETLIGFINDVSTHTSQVKLMSDVTMEMPVTIGRIVDDMQVVVLPDPFWMKGMGHGEMMIPEVKRSYINLDEIAVGDLVLTPEGHQGLPTSMCIGEIIRIEPDRKNPLLVDLLVVPRVNEHDLQRVYVFDPQELDG